MDTPFNFTLGEPLITVTDEANNLTAINTAELVLLSTITTIGALVALYIKLRTKTLLFKVSKNLSPFFFDRYHCLLTKTKGKWRPISFYLQCILFFYFV